jgi:hypothetical protein
MADDPKIEHALAAVMADVGAVAKRDKNTAQGFNFRGIDAVVNAVGPILRKHRVLTIPVVEDAHYETIEVGQKRSLMRQCTLRVRWEFHGPAGDHIAAVVVAEAMDSGDKATSKAHSVAYRTALLQVLCIPTDEPDADASSYERSEARGPVVDTATAQRIADVLNRAGVDARKAWLDEFKLPPAALPVALLAAAETFLATLAPVEEVPA